MKNKHAKFFVFFPQKKNLNLLSFFICCIFRLWKSVNKSKDVNKSNVNIHKEGLYKLKAADKAYKLNDDKEVRL